MSIVDVRGRAYHNIHSSKSQADDFKENFMQANHAFVASNEDGQRKDYMMARKQESFKINGRKHEMQIATTTKRLIMDSGWLSVQY